MDEAKDVTTEDQTEVVQETTEDTATVETKAEDTQKPDYQSPSIAELFGGEKPETVETKADEPEQQEVKADDASEEVSETEVPEEKTETVQAKEDVDVDAIIKERDAFRSAMFEERNKRKELEQSKQAEPVSTEDDTYVDDDTRRYVDKKLSEKDNEMLQMKLQMSQAMARSQFKDYDEVVKNFVEAAESNPKLLDAAVATDNPALYAYKEGKKIKFSKEYGDDPEEVEKKMEAKLRSKIKKDLEKELMSKVAAKSKQPTNLSKMRAAGGDRENEWTPASVSDVF